MNRSEGTSTSRTNDALTVPAPLRRPPTWDDLQFPALPAVLEAARLDPQARLLLPSIAPMVANRRMVSASGHSAGEALDDAMTFVDRLFAGHSIGGNRSYDARLTPNSARLFEAGRRYGLAHATMPILAADPIDRVSRPSHAGHLLRSLWRLQEMTLDRFGFLACQSVDSVQAIIATTHFALEANVPASQIAHIVDGEIDQVFYSPNMADFCTLRIVALIKFANSTKYANHFFTANHRNLRCDPVSESPNEPESAKSFTRCDVLSDVRDCTSHVSLYQKDDYVEVCLDGVWQLGQVVRVDSEQDIYIRLASEEAAWHFSLGADMVRPAGCQHDSNNQVSREAA